MITNGNKWMLTSTTDFTGGSHLEDWDVGRALRSEKISDSISPEQNILSLFAAGPEHHLSLLRVRKAQWRKSRTLETLEAVL
jgi:hypothetical protein